MIITASNIDIFWKLFHWYSAE